MGRCSQRSWRVTRRFSFRVTITVLHLSRVRRFVPRRVIRAEGVNNFIPHRAARFLNRYANGTLAFFSGPSGFRASVLRVRQLIGVFIDAFYGSMGPLIIVQGDHGRRSQGVANHCIEFCITTRLRSIRHERRRITRSGQCFVVRRNFGNVMAIVSNGGTRIH